MQLLRVRCGIYVRNSVCIWRGRFDCPGKIKILIFFETDVRQASEAGVSILRAVCLSGRRYEAFGSLESFNAFRESSPAAIQRAEPVLKKYDVKMAIENHKDWRIDELIDIMKLFESEWIGVTLDTGNNMSLLEDPMEVVEALAPYTLTTHFKDMSVLEYEEGFLLSEVPLGKGVLDLKKVISTCRMHNQDVTLNLEMITRDPLKVPCKTERYWETFNQVNGWELARTLRLVDSMPVDHKPAGRDWEK